MAGRARTLAITEELARRVKDTFDPQPEDEVQPTSLDYVCHWIESGKTSKALAKDLEDTLTFPFEYAALMRYLRIHYAGAADERVEEARTRASHCLAEDSLDIVDAHADTQMDVSRAASRARSRQWLAQAWNPSRYGQQKGVSVSVSIGSLHLQALQAAPPRLSTLVTGTEIPALSSPDHSPNTDQLNGLSDCVILR